MWWQLSEGYIDALKKLSMKAVSSAAHQTTSPLLSSYLSVPRAMEMTQSHNMTELTEDWLWIPR